MLVFIFYFSVFKEEHSCFVLLIASTVPSGVGVGAGGREVVKVSLGELNYNHHQDVHFLMTTSYCWCCYIY